MARECDDDVGLITCTDWTGSWRVRPSRNIIHFVVVVQVVSSVMATVFIYGSSTASSHAFHCAEVTIRHYLCIGAVFLR